MKKIILAIIALSLFVFIPLQADAVVRVKGYTKKNGTYVAPHYRSDPDGIKSNNWSYPGNTNPYTGVTAGGSATTYGTGSAYTYTAPVYKAPAVTTQICPVNSKLSGSSCVCNDGYTKSATSENCVSLNDLCASQYGASFYNSSEKVCYCNAGLIYDKAANYCVVPPSIPTSTPTGTNSDGCYYGFSWNDYLSACIAVAPGTVSPSDYYRMADQATTTIKYATALWRVNVRDSASTQGKKLRTVDVKYRFEILDDSGEWAKVKFGNNEGWVRKDLVTIE
ncbi:MAG: SH3 domain-containing protein [Patescibacteria group bacterium]